MENGQPYFGVETFDTHKEDKFIDSRVFLGLASFLPFLSLLFILLTELNLVSTPTLVLSIAALLKGIWTNTHPHSAI